MAKSQQRGRLSPIGPVTALGQITSKFERSSRQVWIDSERRYANYNELGRESRARTLGIRAGSIAIDQVSPDIRLTIGQWRPSTVDAVGNIAFASATTPSLADRERMLERAEASEGVIVIKAYLERLTGQPPSEGVKFELQPVVWDLARPEVHGPERPFDPACGLVYDLETLRQQVEMATEQVEA